MYVYISATFSSLFLGSSWFYLCVSFHAARLASLAQDLLYCYFFLSLFIYLESGWVSWEVAEKERERIPSMLHTASMEPDVGLKLTNREIITWAKVKSQTFNQMSHPGTTVLLLSIEYLV